MFEAFLSPFFIRAVIALVLVSIVSAFAGSFTVFRGSTFMISGVAHSALAGAAFGILMTLYGITIISPIVGQVIFAVALALFVGVMTVRLSLIYI